MKLALKGDYDVFLTVRHDNEAKLKLLEHASAWMSQKVSDGVTDTGSEFGGLN